MFNCTNRDGIQIAINHDCMAKSLIPWRIFHHFSNISSTSHLHAFVIRKFLRNMGDEELLTGKLKNKTRNHLERKNEASNNWHKNVIVDNSAVVGTALTGVLANPLSHLSR